MSPRTTLCSLVLVLSNSARLLAAAVPTDDTQCGCYMTNGTSSAYFTSHKFMDFRDLAQYQQVTNPLTTPADTANAQVTSDYFRSQEWTNAWVVQNWNNSNHVRNDSTVLMVNSPNNIYIEPNTDSSPSSKTFLTFRTLRLPDFQSAAEIESKTRNFKYLSIRMYSRTIGAPGAITAMFTYHAGSSTTKVQEADFEIRTQLARNMVAYTNQPSVDPYGQVIPEATRNVTLPNNRDWTQWAVHRLDWTPTQSTWYVDGLLAANISFQVPTDPSIVILNSWSDGGQWSGNMNLYDQTYMQVQWLEMVYNTTGASTQKRDDRSFIRRLFSRAAGDTCSAVCTIDETNQIGRPALLQNGNNDTNKGNSGNSALSNRQGSGLTGWIPLAVAVATAGLSAHV